MVPGTLCALRKEKKIEDRGKIWLKRGALEKRRRKMKTVEERKRSKPSLLSGTGLH